MTEKYPGLFTAFFKKNEKPVEEPKKKSQKKQLLLNQHLMLKQ